MKARITALLKDNPRHLQDVFGLGAVTTAVTLGEVGNVRRFPSKDHFASYTGTAPVDASSGDTVRNRLNRGGNRRVLFVLHVAAVVQIANKHPEGYSYYQRRRAAGKSNLEAMRCLKRRLSDVVFRARIEDLADREAASPAGHSRATLDSSASDPTPMVSPSDKSLTGLASPDWLRLQDAARKSPLDREETR